MSELVKGDGTGLASGSLMALPTFASIFLVTISL